MQTALNPNTQRDHAATLVSIARLRAKADAAGAVDAMRHRAAAARLEDDLTEDDASRREAERAVIENQRAAERFAVQPAPVAMVPQPCQQQQAKGRETAAEWGARMRRQHPTPTPRPAREDSPAMKAGLAIAADAGRSYAERQNAARETLDITEAPARAGRYGRAA